MAKQADAVGSRPIALWAWGFDSLYPHVGLTEQIRAAFGQTDGRLTIYANSDVSRGKYAAAAVHAALLHYGIPHGAVIVLGARPGQIEESCDLVIRDAGMTEVKPGTITAGVRRE